MSSQFVLMNRRANALLSFLIPVAYPSNSMKRRRFNYDTWIVVARGLAETGVL
jgi:hypothetical protein